MSAGGQQYKVEKDKTMTYYTNYSSFLGRITVAEKNGGITGLCIEGQRGFAALQQEKAMQAETPVLIQAKAWLDRYFSGERPDIGELKLTAQGGEFRCCVWNILCEIPYGETMSYGEVARLAAFRMGKERMSAQAVGGAVGHNPISIIIPCHRVIGSDGNLTGYAGGIDLKVKLLEHEGVDMSQFYFPKR